MLNSVSFRALGSTNGTPVTNQYGFYSDVNITRATNSWSVYANGTASSYFGGNVGIGTTTPTVALDVVGVIKDAIGNVRDIVNSPQTAAYIPAVTDNGEMINITTGGVTLNSGIFSPGNNITVYNNSAVSQTITQGAGVTLRLAGSATTGNRTLAQRGICTIVCVASNEFVISGAGLS